MLLSNVIETSLYRLDLSECSEFNYEFYEDVKVFYKFEIS